MRETVFEHSIFPYDPSEPEKSRIVWRTQGTVVGKHFWTTDNGIAGYYEVCRGTYTGDKKDDTVLLPISVIECIWSA